MHEVWASDLIQLGKIPKPMDFSMADTDEESIWPGESKTTMHKFNEKKNNNLHAIVFCQYVKTFCAHYGSMMVRFSYMQTIMSDWNQHAGIGMRQKQKQQARLCIRCIGVFEIHIWLLCIYIKFVVFGFFFIRLASNRG